MAKAGAVMTYGVDEAKGTVTIGAVGVTDTVVLDVRKLIGEELYDLLPPVGRAMILHGGKQKSGDGAATSRDEKTGLPATPQERFDAAARIVKHLMGGGAFNAKAPGGAKLSAVETDKLLEELRARGITV